MSSPSPVLRQRLPRFLISCSGEDWVTMVLFLIAATYLLLSESFWRGLPFGL
jgi:hypothetical protein